MRADQLWERVDRLVDRAATIADLRAHGLHLLAWRRRRALGLPVPDRLAAEHGLSVVRSLAVPAVLERVRNACEGPLVLMKGPELAARYPDPALRPFLDVDLLVPDPPACQAALRRAGFEPVGDPELYAGIHHLRPLRLPGLPLVVELHGEPKWLAHAEPPRAAELLAAAVPSAAGVDGVSAPAPAHHALLVAAHSWAHVPLGSLKHLVDVAALLTEAEEAEVAALARRWGVPRLWATTAAATRWALRAGRAPGPVALWAGNVRAVRERRVLESHVERLAAPFWALPPGLAFRTSLEGIAHTATGAPDEPAQARLRRAGRALRDAFWSLSDHHVALGRGDTPAEEAGR